MLTADAEAVQSDPLAAAHAAAERVYLAVRADPRVAEWNIQEYVFNEEVEWRGVRGRRLFWFARGGTLESAVMSSDVAFFPHATFGCTYDEHVDKFSWDTAVASLAGQLVDLVVSYATRLREKVTEAGEVRVALFGGLLTKTSVVDAVDAEAAKVHVLMRRDGGFVAVEAPRKEEA